jgi:hypothetical protein
MPCYRLIHHHTDCESRLGRIQDNIQRLKQNADSLTYNPEMNEHFAMRLYRLNVEWRALRTQAHFEEDHEQKCLWRSYERGRKRMAKEPEVS